MSATTITLVILWPQRLNNDCWWTAVCFSQIQILISITRRYRLRLSLTHTQAQTHRLSHTGSNTPSHTQAPLAGSARKVGLTPAGWHRAEREGRGGVHITWKGPFQPGAKIRLSSPFLLLHFFLSACLGSTTHTCTQLSQSKPRDFTHPPVLWISKRTHICTSKKTHKEYGHGKL